MQNAMRHWRWWAEDGQPPTAAATLRSMHVGQHVIAVAFAVTATIGWIAGRKPSMWRANRESWLTAFNSPSPSPDSRCEWGGNLTAVNRSELRTAARGRPWWEPSPEG